MNGKWSKGYWLDLAERVGSTLLGALLTMITLDGATSVNWSDGKAVWLVLGVPTATSLLKGLLANMAKTDTTGASVLGGLPFKNDPPFYDAKGSVDNNLVIGLVLGFAVGVIIVLLL